MHRNGRMQVQRKKAILHWMSLITVKAQALAQQDPEGFIDLEQVAMLMRKEPTLQAFDLHGTTPSGLIEFIKTHDHERLFMIRNGRLLKVKSSKFGSGLPHRQRVSH